MYTDKQNNDLRILHFAQLRMWMRDKIDAFSQFKTRTPPLT